MGLRDRPVLKDSEKVPEKREACGMLSSCAVAAAELPTVGKPQPLIVRLVSLEDRADSC